MVHYINKTANNTMNYESNHNSKNNRNIDDKVYPVVFPQPAPFQHNYSKTRNNKAANESLPFKPQARISPYPNPENNKKQAFQTLEQLLPATKREDNLDLSHTRQANLDFKFDSNSHSEVVNKEMLMKNTAAILSPKDMKA